MSQNRRDTDEDNEMRDRDNDSRQIDRATSASLCSAIGERLQQTLGPEAPIPSSLQRLIDEMHRQETLGKSYK
jgi:hypothetical protein